MDIVGSEFFIIDHPIIRKCTEGSRWSNNQVELVNPTSGSHPESLWAGDIPIRISWTVDEQRLYASGQSRIDGIGRNDEILGIADIENPCRIESA